MDSNEENAWNIHVDTKNKLYLKFPPLKLADLERNTRIMPEKLPIFEDKESNNNGVKTSENSGKKRSRILPQKLPIIDVDLLCSHGKFTKGKKKLLPERFSVYPGKQQNKSTINEKKSSISNNIPKRKDSTFAKPKIRKPLWENCPSNLASTRSSLVVSKKGKIATPSFKKSTNKKITEDVLKDCDISEVGILEETIIEQNLSNTKNTNSKKNHNVQFQINSNIELLSTPDSLLNFEYEEKTFQAESMRANKNNLNQKIKELGLSIYNDLKEIENKNPEIGDLLKGAQQKAHLITKLVTCKEDITTEMKNDTKPEIYDMTTPKIPKHIQSTPLFNVTNNLQLAKPKLQAQSITTTPRLNRTLINYNKLKKLSKNILETPTVVVTNCNGTCKREIHFRDKSSVLSKKVMDQLNMLY